MTGTTLEAIRADANPGTQPQAAEGTRGKRKRLPGIDAARGISLLGMITLHALYESDAAGRPTWSYTAFSGKAAAAFAVLIGVGMTFATGRRRVRFATGKAPAMALVARALAIAAIGLVLGGMDEMLNSVILPYIGAMILLAIPLVFLPTWTIAMIGVLVVTGMPALTHVLQPHLPEPSLGNATFGYLVNDPLSLLSELSITGFYPALTWLAYLCAGLVIGRLNLTRMRVTIALLAVGAVLAVAAAAASSALLHQYGGLAHVWAAQSSSGLTADETTELLTLGGNGTTPASTWWWLTIDRSHTGTPFDIVGTAGIAIAMLGLMLFVGSFSRPVARRLVTVVQTPLAAVGGLTLSFYAAHILFINSDYDTYSATTGWLVQIVAALLIGVAWQATVGRGPLEGIVVLLTNHARQRAARAGVRH